MTELLVNFSDARAQADLFFRLRKLRGSHRITVVKFRRRHSDAQRGYYFACIVSALADYLHEQGCEEYTEDFAHSMLKQKYLRVAVCNKEGEPIGERTRSITELNVEDFSVYIEQCIAYLSEMFGIVVPDPDIYKTTHGAST